MDEATRNYLWLNYATSMNPRLFFELLSRFDDLSEAREAVLKRDFEAFSDVSEIVRDRLIAAADDRFLDRYCGWLLRNEVKVITPESDEYPALLSEIYDPPSVLFYKGTLPKELPLPIAMVGARNCTDYGREVAELLGEQLAERGATVVTGLAAGIDSAAAKGALSVGASTCPVIGVLGCGIDVVYPQGNGALYEQVIERGAIVTEFLPKTPPIAQNFPIRNRIMSGISRGVVVIEAGERSGTSITADCAGTGTRGLCGAGADHRSDERRHEPHDRARRGKARDLRGGDPFGVYRRCGRRCFERRGEAGDVYFARRNRAGDLYGASAGRKGRG